MKYIFLFFLVAQALMYNLGFHLGWSVFHYDEIRLVLILATILGLLSLIFSLNKIQNQYVVVNFFLIFLSLFFIFKNIYSIYDFVSIFSLFFLIYYIKSNLRGLDFDCIWVLLIYFSCLPLFLINFSIYNLIERNIWFDWQLNGGSIRILDSILVCLFFMIFFLKSKNNNYIDKIYYFYVFYLFLALFFDGARSALLAIIFSLFVLIFYKENRTITCRTILTLVVSFIVYYTIKLINKLKFKDLIDLKGETIFIKNTTSGRFDIWNHMYDKFLDSPFLGIGGGYLAGVNINVNHAHNFYIRLLFEWGFLGFIFLIFLFIYLLKIYREINKIFFFGIFSIFIDALFSGNLIYAPSQLFVILFIGFALSKENKISKKDVNSLFFFRVVFFFWFFLYFYIFIFYLSNDFFCWGCGSFYGIEAPNFWYYGSAGSLVDGSKIP